MSVCWKSLVSQLDELKAKAEEMGRDGQTVVFAAVDGRAAGLLGIADPVRPEAPERFAICSARGFAS